MSAPDAPKRYVAFPLFLVFAALVWMAPFYWKHVEIDPGATGYAYENSELYHYVYPAYDFVFGQIHAGRFPLWTDRQFAGLPLHIDPRLGLFQPLNLIFALGSPTEQAMAIHAVASLALMGIGFVLFARAVGLGYVAALTGAVILAFSGASAAAMSRPYSAGVAAWAPFCLWALREYAREWRPAWAAAAGLALGLAALAGSASIALAYAAAAAVYALALVFSSPERKLAPLHRRLGGLLLALLVALGVAAVQWGPTLWWVVSADADPAFLLELGVEAQIPKTFREWALQTLLARPGAVPRIAYVSIAAIALLPAAIFHRTLRRTVLILAGMAATLAALLITLPQAHASLAPAVALIYPLVFCVAALAALAIDRLLREPASLSKPGLIAPIAAVAAFAAVLFYVSAAQVRGYLLALALLIALLAAMRFRPIPAVIALGIALLIYLDLSVANVSAFRHPYLDAPDCYETNAEAFSAAQRLAVGGRVLISSQSLDPALPENLGFLRPIPVAGGAHLPVTAAQREIWTRLGAPPSSLLRSAVQGRYAGAAQPDLINLLAVRAVIAGPDGSLYGGAWDRPGPRLHLLHTIDDVRVFENDGAMSRAYWRSAAEIADSPEAALDRIASGEADLSRIVLLEPPPNAGLPSGLALGPVAPDLQTDARCSLESLRPEHVTVRVNAPAPGYVVLLDAFAPGWRATLDGESLPIYRANGAFRAVAVPAGEHLIHFVYHPAPLFLCAAVSALCVAGCFLLAVASILRSLSRPAPQPQPAP